jgi:acetyl esterase/lipase
MIKAIYTLAVLVFFGGLLYHFAALKIFNAVVPKDNGSELIARHVAFGPAQQQRLNIFRPKKFSGTLPVLFFAYGGSWSSGNADDYDFVGRAFAAQGYLTLVTSYRLRPEHAYPDFIRDMALTVKFAHDHATEYGGDGERIYAVGHSAGAYNIAMVALDQQYFQAAGVDKKWLKAVALLAGPFDFLPLDAEATIATFGAEKDLATTQPINFARADAPPILLLHGTADTTVYPKNSRSLQRHLMAAGAQATLKEYQGVSHVGIMLSLAKPLRGNAPTLADIVAFFKDNS